MLLKNKIVYQTWRDRNVTDLMRELGAAVTEDGDGEYDLAVFTGGADICPFLYGEKPISSCGSILYHRDKAELHALHNIPFGKPILGICRGAQLLNVHAGGRLYQHVDNHYGDHQAMLSQTGRVVTINSIHHQMMRPPKHAKLLLQAGESTTKLAENHAEQITFDGRKLFEDPECLWIPHHNYLCFQGHPEYAARNSDTRKVWESFVIDYVLPLI